MMKKIIFVFTLILMITLSACSQNAMPVEDTAQSVQTTPTSLMAEYLTSEFEDAASLRSQLAFGTILLDNTEQKISVEQAKILLPLWQAILALESNPDSAEQELTAVQDQIVTAMEPIQLNHIKEMLITNEQLSIFYTEQGITLPTPSVEGTPASGSGGKNSGLSTEEREATKTAAEALGTPVGSNSGSTGADRKNVLTEAVIEYLIKQINQ